MKIAQVISTPPFAWATGGCARVVYDLSKGLVRKGHEVTILTTDLYKPSQRYSKAQEYSDGVNILRFPYVNNILAWNYKVYISPKLISYLKDHLREYELIHLHDLISMQAYATSKYCIKYKIPYIVSTHGSATWLSQKRILNRSFNRFAGYMILENAEIITVLNKNEAKDCRDLGILKDIIVLNNPIDMSNFKNLPKRMEFKDRYGINYESKIILYLGRIEKSKGLDLLVEAFALLYEDLDDAILVISGQDDGYLDDLNRLINKLKIENRVLITGFLDERDKLRAYVDSDVHVSPRSWEPFGMTLIESSACGTPVICSKGCGIAHLIDGNSGLAVTYDKHDLKDALIRILSDKKIRSEFARKGKSLVSEQFESLKMIEKIEKIYSVKKI
jgi:glycosyltransferase involved in cell wall biosynthesis